MKKSKGKGTIGLILSVALVPTIAFVAISNIPAVNQLSKQLTVASAGMTMWSAKSQNTNQANAVNVNTENTNGVNAGGQENSEVSTGSLWSLDMAPAEVETTGNPDQQAAPTPQTSQNVQTQQVTNNIIQLCSSPSNILNAKPYPVSMEAKSGAIKQMAYKPYTGAQIINLSAGGQVRNCTSISNDALIAESKKQPEFKIELNGQPQVLIMHTHTTESYEPTARDFYDASFNSRSTDNTKNVVAVGDAIAKELQASGVAVIHDTTIHDYPQYDFSYDRSRVTVQQILAKYPSIKVVLDVHRDAIQTADGVRTAPVTTIDGKQAAQIMIISGCDDGKMNMPNYMKNFRLSSALQSQMETSYKGLTRPVLFDYRKYNQDLTTGSILLEMGSNGNSYDEAIYSGQLLGKSLSQVLLKLK